MWSWRTDLGVRGDRFFAALAFAAFGVALNCLTSGSCIIAAGADALPTHDCASLPSSSADASLSVSSMLVLERSAATS
ncbi:unnamed protein product [Zymoseptoria tritici ST99CH_3D7]|uniref:Uncharacterized protein n=1 Tax=Zymoseptoria tritici (strain ST99CH_3D7) TaxID=1276538 RepID=A0A1X7S4N7_ZYMT9|nr:unnamed protein product [Zymoseptoria tritici ST99CH_3D7]